jgi:hypothetical protein
MVFMRAHPSFTPHEIFIIDFVMGIKRLLSYPSKISQPLSKIRQLPLHFDLARAFSVTVFLMGVSAGFFLERWLGLDSVIYSSLLMIAGSITGLITVCILIYFEQKEAMG